MSSAAGKAVEKALWGLLIAAELLVICAVALLFGANPEVGWLIALLGLTWSVVCIASSQRRRVALAWTTLAWPACFLVCSCLGLYPLSHAGERARRVQCKNNLKQIALALYNYHAKYRSFPPAYVADSNGRPMHSWRVLLLPFLEETKLYEQYDFSQPWDSAENQRLLNQMPRDYGVYACPNDRRRRDDLTSYVAVVGPETAWPGTRSITLNEITDGPQNTIIIVEVADSDIQWTEPRDLPIEDALAGINRESAHSISSRHAVPEGMLHVEVGANVLFGDGTVRFMPEGLDGDVLHSLLTRAGNDGAIPELVPTLRIDSARLPALVALTAVAVADLIFVACVIVLLRMEKPRPVVGSANVAQ